MALNCPIWTEDADFFGTGVATWTSDRVDPFTPAEQRAIEDTKTRAGRREVKVLGPAHAALQAQKAHTYLAGGPVFVHPVKGTQWSGDQEIHKYWVRLLRQAQV